MPEFAYDQTDIDTVARVILADRGQVGVMPAATAERALIALMESRRERKRRFWQFSERTQQLRAAHRAAREELARVSERDGEETDATAWANFLVIESEKTLPWWKRIDIDCTVG